MITRFRRSVLSLENICSSILMLFAYFLLLRNPLVQLLNAEYLFDHNFKKMFGFVFDDISFIFVFGLSVAALILMSYSCKHEIEISNHVSMRGKNINLQFTKKGYDGYLLNNSNPFLLGSKTLGLRE